MAAWTAESDEEWQVAHVSVVPELMWMAVRLVPAWQPVPVQPAGTVVVWSDTWWSAPWHAVQLVLPPEIAAWTTASGDA